jgi:hypothetical protein
MKKYINKLLVLALCCIPLCGCSIYGDYEDNIETNGVEIEENTTVAETLYNMCGVDLSKEQKEYLEQSCDKVDNIRFIQQSNGKEVSIYASNRVNGAYLLDDGEWRSCLTPWNTRPKECEELYKTLADTAFAPHAFERGANQKVAVECYNREYAVLDFNGETMFSINYPDVDVEIENMPIKAIIYADQGKAEGVELITAVSDYTDRLSEQNLKDVQELLSVLGLGEESESLTRELVESLDKASYSRKDGAITVQSCRDVSRGKKFVYNIFKVSLD